jgi:hypothetical protein
MPEIAAKTARSTPIIPSSPHRQAARQAGSQAPDRSLAVGPTAGLRLIPSMNRAAPIQARPGQARPGDTFRMRISQHGEPSPGRKSQGEHSGPRAAGQREPPEREGPLSPRPRGWDRGRDRGWNWGWDGGWDRGMPHRQEHPSPAEDAEVALNLKRTGRISPDGRAPDRKPPMMLFPLRANMRTCEHATPCAQFGSHSRQLRASTLGRPRPALSMPNVRSNVTGMPTRPTTSRREPLRPRAEFARHAPIHQGVSPAAHHLRVHYAIHAGSAPPRAERGALARALRFPRAINAGFARSPTESTFARPPVPPRPPGAAGGGYGRA